MGKGSGTLERPCLALDPLTAAPAAAQPSERASRSSTERARPTPPRRPSSWNDQRIRQELEPFVAGRDRWPSQAEFRRAGLVQLLSAVLRSGGARRWAAEFDLPLTPPGRKPRWSEQRIATRLADLLQGRDSWPTEAELNELAPGLAEATRRHPDGPAYWAGRFGIPYRPHSRWTEERIRSELSQFLEGRGDWPTHREFKQAGRAKLLQAIYNHGGSQRWAEEFGLQVRPHGRLGQ